MHKTSYAMALVRGQPLGREIVAGLGFVAHDSSLRVFTITGALGKLALTGYQTVLLLFLIREVGVSRATVGVLLATMSVGGVLGALIGGALGQAMGLRPAMWVMTVAVAPLVLLIGPIRKSRDLPVQPCEVGMSSQESGIAPDRYQRHLA
jgi:MFS-type transporter involved in bile tolerance (Atg22 family)